MYSSWVIWPDLSNTQRYIIFKDAHSFIRLHPVFVTACELLAEAREIESPDQGLDLSPLPVNMDSQPLGHQESP